MRAGFMRHTSEKVMTKKNPLLSVNLITDSLLHLTGCIPGELLLSIARFRLTR
jgi:hypothetical protein